MRALIVTVAALLFAGLASAKPEIQWEVRKERGEECEVKRVSERPEVGTKIAGPFKTKKRAEEELDRIKDSRRCKAGRD